MADIEYTRRTAVVRLEVDEEARRLLSETITEWNRGCQLAVNEAWGTCHTRSDVQKLAYDRVREETSLGSQHAVLATHQAAESIKQRREADGSKPEFSAPSVVYDTRTMTLFDDDSVSLTTVESRVRCPIALPEDESAYPHGYLDDDDWEPAKTALYYRDGEFFLHLGFRKEKHEVTLPEEDASVLGVSLGVDNLAVTSTARFFPAAELNHRQREFADVENALEAVGTRSAKRSLRRAGTRQERHARDRLHTIANEIVEEADGYACDAIAFGEIDRVLDELPGAEPFHEWAFQTLFQFVEYKAADRDIGVVVVNPEYTTQRCTGCGFTHPQNRDLERNHFTCLKCGYEQQDDYNAAKNIGFRCIRRGPLSSSGVNASYCTLQSGRVTPDGELVPHPAPRSAAPGQG